MIKRHLCSPLYQQHVCCTACSLRLLSVRFPFISVSADLHQLCRIKRVQKASATHWSSNSSSQNQCNGILVSAVFVFSLSAINTGIIKQVFCPCSLRHHVFPSQFFLPAIFVHIHGSKTVLFCCYQQHVPALFWHWISNPLVITALFGSTLKGTGFRFSLPLASWDQTSVASGVVAQHLTY